MSCEFSDGIFLTPCSLGKAKLRNSFQIFRQHAPQRVILRLYFKFCPQYDPYTSAAGSRHLPTDSNIYSGTATFSLEQLATAFCNSPSPLLQQLKWGDKALLLSKALLDTQAEDVISV